MPPPGKGEFSPHLPHACERSFVDLDDGDHEGEQRRRGAATLATLTGDGRVYRDWMVRIRVIRIGSPRVQFRPRGINRNPNNANK